MKDILLDTSVIIRLFDISEPEQTERSRRLFESAKSGRVHLVIAPPVLFEVAWVLKSAVKRPNEEILDVLEALVGWPGVRVPDGDCAKQAIRLGRSRKCGFADAYLAVTAQNNGYDVATFDARHFRKLGATLHDLK